jgi:hypothetical protein
VSEPVSILANGTTGHDPRRIQTLAVWPDRAYITGMAKPKSPRVTFKMQRIKEDEWQIQAHYPDVEVRYIKGFKSKAEIDDWLAGSRRIDWLRSQGYAK